MKSYVVIACLLVGSWSTPVKPRRRKWENLKVSNSHHRSNKLKKLEDLALCVRQKNFTDSPEVSVDSDMLEVGADGYDGFHDVGYGLPAASCVSGISEDGRALRFHRPQGVSLPSHVDWRELGAVTAVRDQGRCQSCWAFSAVGALEGQHFLKTGQLVRLSEQNLIDCAGAYGNLGCGGGSMLNAFRYVSDTAGLASAEDYPYRGKSGLCHYKSRYASSRAKGSVTIEPGNEQQLMEAVAFVGPISAAIDASWKSFKHYHQGVYYERRCSGAHRDLTHAVLVVGYGSEPRGGGGDYWLVKNSLGARWGEQGYIRMARNRGNNCGIATVACYPLV